MATMAEPQASAGQPGASAPSSAQRWRPYQIAFWLACLAVVIAFPLVISDPAYTTVAFFTLVFAAAGSAWNIFCGYSGYIALGLGVHTTTVKLSAFVLSAFFVGMCGAVWAYYVESVFPPFAFDALFDVLVALMAFLGGLGTISGPLLGALLLEPAQQYLTIAVGQSGLNLVVEGLVFLLVILLLPEGIVPAASRFLVRWATGRNASPVAPGSASGSAGPPGTPDTPEARGPTAASEQASVATER